MDRSLYSYAARAKRHRDAMDSLTVSMHRLRDSMQSLVDAARKTKSPAYRRAMDETAYRDKLFQFGLLSFLFFGTILMTVGLLTAIMLR